MITIRPPHFSMTMHLIFFKLPFVFFSIIPNIFTFQHVIIFKFTLKISIFPTKFTITMSLIIIIISFILFTILPYLFTFTMLDYLLKYFFIFQKSTNIYRTIIMPILSFSMMIIIKPITFLYIYFNYNILHMLHHHDILIFLFHFAFLYYIIQCKLCHHSKFIHHNLKIDYLSILLNKHYHLAIIMDP